MDFIPTASLGIYSPPFLSTSLVLFPLFPLSCSCFPLFLLSSSLPLLPYLVRHRAGPCGHGGRRDFKVSVLMLPLFLLNLPLLFFIPRISPSTHYPYPLGFHGDSLKPCLIHQLEISISSIVSFFFRPSLSLFLSCLGFLALQPASTNHLHNCNIPFLYLTNTSTYLRVLSSPFVSSLPSPCPSPSLPSPLSPLPSPLPSLTLCVACLNERFNILSWIPSLFGARGGSGRRSRAR